jgi:hypothetical protein
MVDEMKLVRQRARGEEARRLLENSMLKGAFADIEKGIIDAWLATLPAEREEREELYRSVQNLGRLEMQLKSVLYTGAIAIKDLIDIEARKEKQSG